jgi:hypothetical protein
MWAKKENTEATQCQWWIFSVMLLYGILDVWSAKK